MPLPFNRNISFDNIIYINSIDKHYCYIHPNEITILGILFTIITGYFLYTQKSFLFFFIVVFIRTLCDIYDGILARKCNKVSKNGKKLDIFSDWFYVVTLLIISLYKISNNYFILKILIAFMIMITPILYIETEKSNYSFIENNKILKLFHDNTIIIIPIFSVFFYYLTLIFK